MRLNEIFKRGVSALLSVVMLGTAAISTSAAETTASPTDSAVAAGGLTDGTYKIPVKFSQPDGSKSMSEGAVEPFGYIKIKGGEEILTVTFKGMYLEYFKTTGHLLSGAVFPTKEGYDKFCKTPKDIDKYITPVEVKSYFEDTVFSEDGKATEKAKFPQDLEFKVPQQAEYNGKKGFMFRVVVDAMQQLFGMGGANVMIRVDYSKAIRLAEKDALEKAVKECGTLDEKIYTEESLAKLQDEIKKSKKLLSEKDAKQAEVDSQIISMENARKALEKKKPKTNKQTLQQNIANAEKVDFSKYTSVTEQQLKNAVKEAKAVLADEYANQQTVDGAAEKVAIAMTKLEKKKQEAKKDSKLEKDNLANGKYYVGVDLWKANINEPSMGNGALNHKALLEVKDGVYKLTVSGHPMTVGTVTASLLTLQVKNTNGNYEFAEIAARNLPGNKPSEFRFVMPSKNDYLDVKIDPQVEVMGKDPIAARLKISWDTLKKTSDDATADKNTETSVNGVKTPAISLEDKNTGISASAAENVLVSGVKMKAEKIENRSDINSAREKLKLSDNQHLDLYDICMMSPKGNSVQPNGKVWVSVPICKNSGKVTVYRMNSDGTTTIIGGEKKNGKYVFAVNHFSRYAVVSEKNAAENNAGADMAKTESPLTGDKAVSVIALVLAVSACAAVTLIKRKAICKSKRYGE